MKAEEQAALTSISRALTIAAAAQASFGAYLAVNAVLNFREARRVRREIARQRWRFDEPEKEWVRS